jgi:hypothetical protein
MQQKSTARVAIVSSLVTILIVAVVGGGGYLAHTTFIAPWWHQYQASQQSRSIIDAVSRVVLLPHDEDPQVMTIIDAAQLKQGNEFFAAAEDGDATLYYPTSGIIILFDTKNNKLINMGNVASSTVSGALPLTTPKSSL